MAELVFDEDMARRIEGLYRIRDAARRRAIVREALAAAPGERMLDVGCGPGFYCAELLEEVGPEGSVVGLDASQPMLTLAARRCEGRGNAAFHEADAQSLPVGDADFDGAVCVQVLEYVPDPTAALREMHRALRPGGRVVVWDVDWPTAWWRSADVERMQRILRAWDEHLVHPALPRTLADRLQAAGFEDVHVQGHSFETSTFDPETYGTPLISLIAEFVAGRDGLTEEDAQAWAAEQRDLGERGGFFFTCVQFCFSARRP